MDILLQDFKFVMTAMLLVVMGKEANIVDVQSFVTQYNKGISVNQSSVILLMNAGAIQKFN